MKLQVSFAKEPYKRDTTLQKRPRIVSILLIIATPYVWNFMLIPSSSHMYEICTCPAACVVHMTHSYGVATISRFLKIIGLFCRISSLLQGSFVKETYNFKEPTNRSHPIRDDYLRYSTHKRGVATISRLLKITGLFGRISSLLQGSFAKETYHFKEPTNRSHPICVEERRQVSLMCRVTQIWGGFHQQAP